MTKNCSVAVIEPNYLIRVGLRGVFARSAFRIALEAASVEDFRQSLPSDCEIGAILVGFDPESKTLEDSVRELREVCPGARIVLMAQSASEQSVMQAARAGIDGFIVESTRGETIVKSLELVALGERVFPMQMLQVMWRHDPRPTQQAADAAAAIHNLSSREIQVLDSLCQGSANKVIARELGISEATVKVHVKAILRKMRAKNRTEAALRAKSLGLGRGAAIGEQDVGASA